MSSADVLLAYRDAVHAETVRFVRSLDDADLERVVDARWGRRPAGRSGRGRRQAASSGRPSQWCQPVCSTSHAMRP